MAGGVQLGGSKASSGVFGGLRLWLLSPSILTIGFFLVLPVGMMLIYSFLTKEFRGGVIWEFSLAAYDQFIFDRGLFGDEPPRIEWTYITIFCPLDLAGRALQLCCASPSGSRPHTSSPPVRSSSRSAWLFLVTVPYWVNLLIRTVSMKFLIRDTGPANEFLLWLGVIVRADPL